MATPKADPPKCDVPGCGAPAETMTDGTEKDVAVRRVEGGGDEPLNRKALHNLNVCNHHSNWPFSDDAKAFASAGDTAAKYQARATKGK